MGRKALVTRRQAGSSVGLPAPPVISSFTASPTGIGAGEASTLSWSISGATSASIDNGVGAVVPLSGTRDVSPSANVTYILTATNAGGSVTRSVTVSIVPDDALYPPVGVPGGLNLERPIETCPEFVFSDITKRGAPWVATPFPTFDQRTISWDSDGYPLTAIGPTLPLQKLTTALINPIKVGFDAFGNPVGMVNPVWDTWATPTGDYTLQFRGKGTVEVAGLGQSATQIFVNSTGAPVEYTIHNNDPKAACTLYISGNDPTDHIRDIHLWLPLHPTFESGKPLTRKFYEPTIRRLRGLGVLRFMDWTGTNYYNATSDWASRMPETFRTWTERSGIATTPELVAGHAVNAGRGCPLEVIIDLCNELGCHPWVNIPYPATTDFVANLAQLFVDRLDWAGAIAGKGPLNVKFEYGNEWFTSGLPTWDYCGVLSGYGVCDLPAAGLDDTSYPLELHGVTASVNETTGNMTAGSAVLGGIANLKGIGQGQTITVVGAGAAGADLNTTVASRDGPSQVTLAAPAGTTVTGAVVRCGTKVTVTWPAHPHHTNDWIFVTPRKGIPTDPDPLMQTAFDAGYYLTNLVFPIDVIDADHFAYVSQGVPGKSPDIGSFQRLTPMLVENPDQNLIGMSTDRPEGDKHPQTAMTIYDNTKVDPSNPDPYAPRLYTSINDPNRENCVCRAYDPVAKVAWLHRSRSTALGGYGILGGTAAKTHNTPGHVYRITKLQADVAPEPYVGTNGKWYWSFLSDPILITPANPSGDYIRAAGYGYATRSAQMFYQIRQVMKAHGKVPKTDFHCVITAPCFGVDSLRKCTEPWFRRTFYPDIYYPNPGPVSNLPSFRSANIIAPGVTLASLEDCMPTAHAVAMYWPDALDVDHSPPYAANLFGVVQHKHFHDANHWGYFDDTGSTSGTWYIPTRDEWLRDCRDYQAARAEAIREHRYMDTGITTYLNGSADMSDHGDHVHGGYPRFSNQVDWVASDAANPGAPLPQMDMAVYEGGSYYQVGVKGRIFQSLVPPGQVKAVATIVNGWQAMCDFVRQMAIDPVARDLEWENVNNFCGPGADAAFFALGGGTTGIWNEFDITLGTNAHAAMMPGGDFRDEHRCHAIWESQNRQDWRTVTG
jgi:hypothetical protein